MTTERFAVSRIDKSRLLAFVDCEPGGHAFRLTPEEAEQLAFRLLTEVDEMLLALGERNAEAQSRRREE